MSMKWAHSILDWRSHAVDEQRRHPTGVFKAECGHTLGICVELRDEPRGQVCEACAMTQASRAMTRLDH